MRAPRRYVVGQFRLPRGPMGHLAGWIMARRGSNRTRNLWTLELLDIESDHRVLEIGFGPGYAIEQLTKRLTEGSVVGIDHSPAMVRQATRRNHEAVLQGRVDLRCESVDALRSLRGPFDRVYSANVAQFWPDRAKVFTDILEILNPGGRVATTYQPRHANASDADAVAFGKLILKDMRSVGFVDTRLCRGPRNGVLTVSATGTRPRARTD